MRNLAEQTVLKSDSLSVKARLSQQRYQLLVLQDITRVSKRNLSTGFSRAGPGDGFLSRRAASSHASKSSISAAARKAAAEQRSEIRARPVLQTKKTELDIRRERAEYLPDISLQISYVSLPNTSTSPQNILSAGFPAAVATLRLGTEKT